MSLTHWNYFLALEDSLENLSKYIEFNNNNNNTYSVETAKILMTATQEVDVLLKAICKYNGSNADKIHEYYKLMNKIHPDIFKMRVSLPRYSIEFRPFQNWTGSESPIWWEANNNVKHERDTKFHKASLTNATEAVCALFLINIYYYIFVKGIRPFMPDTNTKLFKADGGKFVSFTDSPRGSYMFL